MKCKDEELKGKSADIWFRYVSRPIGFFVFKYFMLNSPITANQLTILSVILSMISAYMISLRGYYYPILGCLLLQIGLVIDCMDGIVARYKKTTGLFGKYVEELSHNIIPTFLMFGLGINSFKTFSDIRIIYILGLTIISMYFSKISRSSKTELLVWHIGVTKKTPRRIEMPKLTDNPRKNLFEKIVFLLIHLFNSPGTQQTLLLIIALFGYIHYALFLFFLFYFIIAIFKVAIEYRSGFKIYGMKR